MQSSPVNPRPNFFITRKQRIVLERTAKDAGTASVLLFLEDLCAALEDDREFFEIVSDAAFQYGQKRKKKNMELEAKGRIQRANGR